MMKSLRSSELGYYRKLRDRTVKLMSREMFSHRCNLTIGVI